MSNNSSFFSNIKGDFASGLVVFLIAVPLCLGIALASGAPLYSGIVSGIIGGIVVGLLSKSQLSVTGPAAGLTAIVLAAISELKTFDIFLCAVMVAGAIQLLLGILKAGTVSNYFPSNVIEGMLTAIGIIIILKQIPHALGVDMDAEGDMAFKEASGNTFSTIVYAITHPDAGAVIITLVSMGLILLWMNVPALSKLKLLPGALVAVLAGAGLNELFIALDSPLALGASHLVNLPIPDSINGFIEQFTLPNFSGFAQKEVWVIGATIAIVASIETLLCVEATDKLDPMKRYSPPNRELMAQGIGNMLSGLIGGIPMTSVIVRSSANINAGGRTKAATIIHGTLLLICVALIPMLLNKIPFASLAAILIMTGYKLCKPSVFIHMKENGKYQFIPFLVTVLAVVFTDLLTGVGLGLIVSVFAILRGNMKSAYFFRKRTFKTGEIVHMYLSQEVSFLNKAAIKLTLEHLPEKCYLIIDASNSEYIDHDVIELIREFKEVKATDKKIKVDLVGFKSQHKLENTLQSPEFEGILLKPEDQLLPQTAFSKNISK
jgi:carbonic anhydrase